MASSSLASARPPLVYIGDTLAGVALRSDVFCDMVSLHTAPGLSTARLSHKYGRVALNGSAKFARAASLDLRGKYVKISHYNSSDAETAIFYGIVANQEDTPLGSQTITGSAVVSGDNVYNCVSLDFLLDRIYVDSTTFETYGTVKTIFPFNGNSGSVIEKNRSAAKSGGSYLFSVADTAQEWTALDILEYLVAKFTTATGFTWTLGGQYAYLANYKPTGVNPLGKTIKRLLNEIISPDFGFSYHIVVTANQPVIYVFSISDVDISSEAIVILPKNANETTISSNFEYSRVVGDAKIMQVEQSAYNYIRVFSEPVRVMATFKLGTDTGGMQIDWKAADETNYAAETLEYKRQDETYDKLYAAFALGASWDKKDYLGNAVIPTVNESDLTVSFSTSNPFVWPARSLDAVLPLLKDSAKLRDNFQKPFVLMKDEDGNFQFAEKTAFDGSKERPSVGLRLMDDKPGLMLRPPYQHIAGKNHFSVASDYQPIYDYADSLATVSFFTDAVLAIKIAGASASGVSKTKEIYAPGYHYWLGLQGTYTDRQRALANLTTYRDDRAELKKIAALAKAWYGRLRNTVTFSTREITAISEKLGYMVTSVYTGGSFTTVGTILSSITYDFISYRTIYQSDFTDINFTRISRKAVSTDMKVISERLAKIEEKTREIPSRNPSPSITEKRLAVITAKTDTWTYTANIYSNRDRSALETGATIKVMANQLASGETIPTGAEVEVEKKPHGTSPVVWYWTVKGLPRSL